MNIYVDADACPVVDCIISVAKEDNIPVILVKNYAHFSRQEDEDHVEVIYVDTGADVADFQIMKLAKKNDIVVTQDYGLASLCLGKGCTVLHHKGFVYTLENIDQLLHSRHASAVARRGGERTRGPKAFTASDEEKFEHTLRESIDKYKKMRS